MSRTKKKRGGKPRGKPRGKPFVKGDPRINRAGVPAEVAEFNKHVREELARLLTENSRFSLPGETASRLQCVLLKAIEQAEGGDPVARNFVIERIGGHVVQAIEASGRGGGPIQIISYIPRPDRGSNG